MGAQVQIFKKTTASQVVSLDENEFYEYVKQFISCSYSDIVVEINQLVKIPINSAKFISNSEYFEAMLVGSYAENYWNQRMDVEK